MSNSASGFAARPEEIDCRAHPDQCPHRQMSTAERYKLGTGRDLPARTPESERRLQAFYAEADRLTEEYYGSGAAA